jgi:NTP pyrophosphatase (non-canonical NTP hydrolase)
MKVCEYQKLAARTMATDVMKAPPLAVWALGLAGEMEELRAAWGRNMDEAREEAGDLMWYAAATATSLDIVLREPRCVGFGGAIADLGFEIGRVVERIKKHVGHGHRLDAGAVAESLGVIVDFLASLFGMTERGLGSIMDANIAKLRARYPDGFSTERSINRDEKSMAFHAEVEFVAASDIVDKC